MSDIRELSMVLEDALSESAEATTRDGRKLTLCVSPLSPDIFGWRVGPISTVGLRHGRLRGELERWSKETGAKITGVKNEEHLELERKGRNRIERRVFTSIPTAVDGQGQTVPVPMKFFAFATRIESLEKFYYQRYVLNDREETIIKDNLIKKTLLDRGDLSDRNRRERSREKLYWWGLRKPPSHEPDFSCLQFRGLNPKVPAP